MEKVFSLLHFTSTAALHYAAIGCDDENLTLVETLLEAHADINATNDDGISPLLIACNNNHQKLTTFLLKRGAKSEFTHEPTKGAIGPLFMLTHSLTHELLTAPAMSLLAQLLEQKIGFNEVRKNFIWIILDE